MGLVCLECGLPTVPFGGEDVCLESCAHCGSHDCQCEPSEPNDEDPEEG